MELKLDEIPSYKFSSLRNVSVDQGRKPRKDVSLMNHTIDEYMYKKTNNYDSFPSEGKLMHLFKVSFFEWL